MIELGLEGKDKVTNFSGIITARAQYLTGCDQYLLTPKVDKDGNAKDGKWVDEGRIEIIGEGINKKEVQTKIPGGPHDDTPPMK